MSFFTEIGKHIPHLLAAIIVAIKYILRGKNGEKDAHK